MASVRLEGVRKLYDDTGQVAVHGVDLTIADGEFVVLVGPSGCGKSTTLRMIAGLESISGGQLWIGDRLVNEVAPKDRNIAMVFQNYALYPHMTAYDNMAFALKLARRPRSEIDERVREAAGILGLDELLHRKPRAMSGGQRQRVALGRAIVRHPAVFLFDEPLSNLDAKLRVQMRREIAQLHRRLGTTMVYVTHDQVEAMTLGDRIVVLNAGHVMQVDTPLALYQHPANRFVAGFIGSPAMNFIEGTIAADAPARFAAAGGSFTIPLEEERAANLRGTRRVVLGVRPEDVRLARPHGNGTIPATVELIEPMGGESYLNVRAGTHDLTVRLPAGALPSLGDEVALELPHGRLHFFDEESGRAL